MFAAEQGINMHLGPGTNNFCSGLIIYSTQIDVIFCSLNVLNLILHHNMME